MTTPEDTELREKLILIRYPDGIEPPNGSAINEMVRHAQEKHIDRLMNLITLHTQRAETKARINEHSELWDIVPSFAEHVGTVKEISDLRVLKLEAQLTNPTEEGEL